MLEDAKRLYLQKRIEVQYILINVAVFLLLTIINFIAVLSKTNATFAYNWLSVPAGWSSLLIKPWTLATYMFTHIGLFHLLSNIVWLYMSGRIFVDLLGKDRFIKTYWMGGLVGALFYIIAYNYIPGLSSIGAIMLGASASVIAVFISITLYVPDYSVNLMFIGPVKLKYIALVFIILSLPKYQVNTGGNIAHLGGAAWGLFYGLSLKKGREVGGWFDKILLYLRSWAHHWKNKRNAKTTPSARRSTVRKSNDLPNQKEIDRILDKVSKSGYDSLSKDEKKTLFNASNQG